MGYPCHVPVWQSGAKWTRCDDDGNVGKLIHKRSHVAGAVCNFRQNCSNLLVFTMWCVMDGLLMLNMVFSRLGIRCSHSGVVHASNNWVVLTLNVFYFISRKLCDREPGCVWRSVHAVGIEFEWACSIIAAVGHWVFLKSATFLSLATSACLDDWGTSLQVDRGE